MGFLSFPGEMLLANPGTVAPDEPTADQSVIGFGVSDTRGKHRVQAELKRLEQEARLLEVSLSTFYWRQFNFPLMVVVIFYSIGV